MLVGIDFPGVSLQAAQSKETDRNGRDSPLIPSPIPVLVAEVSECTQNRNVDCSSETAGDFGSEDNLLRLEVEFGSFALGSFCLGPAFFGLEVGFGDVAKVSNPSLPQLRFPSSDGDVGCGYGW